MKVQENIKAEFLPLPAGYKMSKERQRLTSFDKELRTFQDWSDDGYKIIKGSKAVSRNAAGVCVFSGAQVVKYSYPEIGEEEYDEDEYDQDLPGNPNDFGHSD